MVCATGVGLLHLSMFHPVLSVGAYNYLSMWLPDTPSVQISILPTFREVDMGPSHNTIHGNCIPLCYSLISTFNNTQHSRDVMDRVVNGRRALPLGVQLQGWSQSSIWETIILPRPIPSDDLVHPIIASLAETAHSKTEVPCLFEFDLLQKKAMAVNYDSDNDWNSSASARKGKPEERAPDPTPPPPPAPLTKKRKEIDDSFDSMQSMYSPAANGYAHTSPTSPDYQYSPTSPTYSPHINNW
jgi:hypothetical protein